MREYACAAFIACPSCREPTWPVVVERAIPAFLKLAFAAEELLAVLWVAERLIDGGNDILRKVLVLAGFVGSASATDLVEAVVVARGGGGSCGYLRGVARDALATLGVLRFAGEVVDIAGVGEKDFLTVLH